MADSLKIFTFGNLTLLRNETPVRGFVSRKVEALLVYLACNRHEHPREALSALLWDDVPQERAMSNLRMVLSSLQQQLAPFVLVTRQTVELNTKSAFWLDVAALEGEIELAGAHLKRTDDLPRSVAVRLEKALNLYRGDFLAGFHMRGAEAFEQWMIQEQSRLRIAVIGAWRWLVEHSLRRQAFAEGIERAQRLLALDPLLEEGHRALMRFFVGIGQRNAALAQFETCRRVLEMELAVEPEPETLNLFHQIQQGQVASPRRRPTHNLPGLTTTYIPRPGEMAHLTGRLDHPDCRLLTVVGAGGTGKTRLAMQAAAERLGDFLNGVFWVPLIGINSPQLLPLACAKALNLSIQRSEALREDFLRYLRDKHLLLMFDNFEHLLEGVDFLAEILAAAPRVKLLVTSRERLGLREEWLMPVGGMAYPASVADENFERYDAVRLFVNAAEQVQAQFNLNKNRKAILEICRRVEGLPLALELAAAWTRTMSCQDIAEELAHNFSLLESTWRNMPQRHRSIRIVFEHSWQLLSKAEQEALCKLSVFRGTFDAIGASHVAGVSPGMLGALVDKSLLGEVATERYALHGLIRPFIHDKMEQTLEASVIEAAQAAHLDYYPEQAEMTVQVKGASQIILEPLENDKKRVTLDRVLNAQKVQLVLGIGVVLSHYSGAHGIISEDRHWLSQGISITHDVLRPDQEATAFFGAGYLAWSQDEFAQARELFTHALSIYEQIKDHGGMNMVYTYLGHVAFDGEDWENAHTYYSQALAIARTLGQPAPVAAGVANLGRLELETCHYEIARRYLEEALAFIRQLGSNEALSSNLLHLGIAAMCQGDYLGAQNYLEEALALNGSSDQAITLAYLGELAYRQKDYAHAIDDLTQSAAQFRQRNDPIGLVGILERCAFITIDQGQPAVALEWLSAAETARHALSAPLGMRSRIFHDEKLRLARTQAKRVAAEQAWAKGAALDLMDALEDALVTLRG